MSLAPKKRGSKDLPPSLSDFMGKRINDASYILQFDSRNPTLGESLRMFLRMSKDVKEIQKATDVQRTAGGLGEKEAVHSLEDV